MRAGKEEEALEALEYEQEDLEEQIEEEIAEAFMEGELDEGQVEELVDEVEEALEEGLDLELVEREVENELEDIESGVENGFDEDAAPGEAGGASGWVNAREGPEPLEGSESTEGQGVEINEENTKKDWAGFGEDLSHSGGGGDHIEVPGPEVNLDPLSGRGHDASELHDIAGYEGDGIEGGGEGFHVLRPRSEDGSFVQSSTFGISLAVLAALAACCCLRRRLCGGGRDANKPHRGKYAALHGNDDFFNGTFSDDISFRGKDSDDDEMSEGSYDSDEEAARGGGGGVRLEMSGMHELDANGGLTLDECNG